MPHTRGARCSILSSPDLINSASVLPADAAEDLDVLLISSLFLAPYIRSVSTPCHSPSTEHPSAPISRACSRPLSRLPGSLQWPHLPVSAVAHIQSFTSGQKQSNHSHDLNPPTVSNGSWNKVQTPSDLKNLGLLCMLPIKLLPAPELFYTTYSLRLECVSY